MKKRNKSASNRRPSTRRSSRTVGANMEALEPRAMLAADLNAWHNPSMGLDVNDDQKVDNADLEIMIAQIQQGNRSFMQTSQTAGGLEGEQVLFLDVNNDGVFNPLDITRMLESLIEAEDADSSYSAAFNFEILQDGKSLGKTSTSFDGNNDPDAGPAISINVEQSVFTLVVTVRNTSALTGGDLDTPDITGAFLDIGFDPLVVQPNEPGTLGEYFGPGTVQIGVTSTGLIKNAGGTSAISNGNALPGGWTADQVLYTIDFTPTSTGTFTLQGLFADATVDDNDPDSKDVNQSAIVFKDLVNPDPDNEDPLDVVNIAFPMITITVEAVPGANNDVVGVSADLIDEIAADDPHVVEIDGEQYLVIDVKANDTDFSGNPLVMGAGVDLTLGANYGLDALTSIADLESRVMVRTTAEYPVAGLPNLSDEYIVYRLPTNRAGTEVFEYTLTDPNDSNNTNTATVTVNISPTVIAVDDLENAEPFATVLPGEEVTLEVLANDYITTESGRVVAASEITIVAIDGDAVTEGRLAISADNKSLLYKGAALPGFDSFTYTISYTDDQNVVHTDTATVTIRVPFNSLISGGFYFDVNYDGVWNDNAGNSASPEQFIGGIQVGLYRNGALVGTTFSSQADGSFNFAGIDAGTYTVKITAPKFVYPYGTGFGGALPPNVSVMSDGTIMISNITISPSTLTPPALGLGFVGRTPAYRGPNDSISNVGENSILFAVSKQPGNEGKLEWYSPDQGWDELLSVEGFLFNTATKTGQAFLRIDHDNDSGTDPVVAPITFSLNDPNFLLIADTSDAVIFRLIGDIETIVDRLSNVDVAFEDF